MSSAMAAGQPQQGNSPLDQARDQGPTSKEQTPKAPGADQQKEQGSKDKPEDKNGGQPKNPLENPRTGENRPGAKLPPGETQPTTPPDDAERWGDLPRRFEETFRTQGGRDVPPQYRDWIEAYYKKLAQKP